MEENQQVWEIQDVLAETRLDLKCSAIFFFNQAEEVEDLEAPVKDVFKSGDFVIAYIGAFAPPESKNKGKTPKNIVNKSDVDVRVVMKTKFRRIKVAFSAEKLAAIDFNKWSETIEVYWYSYP